MNEENLLKQKYLTFNSDVITHVPALKKYAFKITRHNEESEDLVQETMKKAFEFSSTFERGTNIKAWLYRIMLNTFINNYRKTSKEPYKVSYENIEDFFEYLKDEKVKFKHTGYDAFENAFSDEIITALSGLPDDLRTIVFLNDIEGYSYNEIADFTGCMLGTVRSRLHRARKMLYSLLYQYAQLNGIITKKGN